MRNSKQTSIIITGDGPHFGQVIYLAGLVNPDVKVFIGNDAFQSRMPSNHTVKAAKESEIIPEHVLAIMSATNRTGKFEFDVNKKEFRYLSDSNIRVRHPVVLADFLSLNLAGRFVTCGYPGSGNGIVQAILEAILGYRKPEVVQQVSDATSLVSAFAADYYGRLDSTLSLLAEEFGSTLPIQWATASGINASAAFNHSASHSVMYGLPVRNYLFETIHKTHEPYGITICNLIKGGAKCMLAVRNPLDTITSVSAKGAKVGVDILGNEKLLGAVGRGLVAYYESFLPEISKGTVEILKYEDIQSKFEYVTEQLAGFSNTEIDIQFKTKLKKRLLNKPVASSGHLWRPAESSKWKRYLGKRQLDILNNVGVGSISEALGYVCGSDITAGEPLEKLLISKEVKPYFLLHCLEKSGINEFEWEKCGIIAEWVASDVRLFSSLKQAPRIFKNFANRSHFIDLIGAGIS